MTIITILNFFKAIQNSELLSSCFISLWITLLATTFARELRTERYLSGSQPQNKMILVPILSCDNPNIQKEYNPNKETVDETDKRPQKQGTLFDL